MSRFRFRLERVLRARRAAERLQRAELALAEHRARSCEALAESCSDSVDAAREDVRATQAAPSLDPVWVVVAQDAHALMAVVETSLHADADAARSAAAAQRAMWRALRAGVRGLERLEARGREEVRERVATGEERTLEEYTARRAAISGQNGDRRNGARR